MAVASRTPSPASRCRRTVSAFPAYGTQELADGLGHDGTGRGRLSSSRRNGSDVTNDLRWGVYVVFEAPNGYTARCFKEYGVMTDASGRGRRCIGRSI